MSHPRATTPEGQTQTTQAGQQAYDAEKTAQTISCWTLTQPLSRKDVIDLGLMNCLQLENLQMKGVKATIFGYCHKYSPLYIESTHVSSL